MSTNESPGKVQLGSRLILVIRFKKKLLYQDKKKKNWDTTKTIIFLNPYIGVFQVLFYIIIIQNTTRDILELIKKCQPFGEKW